MVDRGARRECLGTKRLLQDGAADLDQMVRNGLVLVSSGVAAHSLEQCVATGRQRADLDVTIGPIADDNSPAVPAASGVHRCAADDLEWPPGSEVRAVMAVAADKVVLDSAARVGQWASTVGEGPGPAHAVEVECAMALDHVGLRAVLDFADRAALDPGDSVADRGRVASQACGRVSVLVMVAGRGAVEALGLIAGLPAPDRAILMARGGWVPVEASAATANLQVRTSMARAVMGGDSDLDSDSQVSKAREALAVARVATANAVVRRASSAATAVRARTAPEASVDVDPMVHLLDQGAIWVVDQGAMAAVDAAADSPAQAASASTAATTMGRRSTKTSIAGQSWLASTSRRGIAIKHSQVSTRTVAEYAELSTARFFCARPNLR